MAKLVGHWLHNADLLDHSGYGNNSEFVPGSGGYVQTPFGWEMQCDGAATVARGSIPETVGFPRTMATWVTQTELRSYSRIFAVVDSEGVATTIGTTTEENTIVCAGSVTSQGKVTTPGFGERFHVIAVFHSEENVEVYINGVLTPSGAAFTQFISGAIPNSSHSIGGRWNASHFCGMAQDCRLYAGAFTQAEAESLYNALKETSIQKTSVRISQLPGCSDLSSEVKKFEVNAITNGNMEGPYVNGLAPGWSVTDPNGEAIVREETSLVDTGSSAQRFTMADNYTGYPSLNQQLSVRPGHYFKIRVRVRSYAGSDTLLSKFTDSEYLTGTTTHVRHIAGHNFSNTGIAVNQNYQTYEGLYFLKSGSVYFHLSKLGATDYLIDNVEVLEYSGLVAAWNDPVGELWPDISGNGFNVSLNGPLPCKGAFGKALQFDGVDDYGNAGTDLDLNELTLAFRIKTTSASTQSIYRQPSSLNHPCKIMIVGSGQIMVGNGPLAENNYVTANALDLTLDVYRSIVVVYDGVDIANTKVYVNGEDFGSLAQSAAYGDPGTFTIIGKRIDGAYPINGILADMRIYNTNWTLADAEQYHDVMVRQTTYYEDFSGESADGLSHTPAGCTLLSGSYKTGAFSLYPGNPFESFDFTDGVWTTLSSTNILSADSFGTGEGQDASIIRYAAHPTVPGKRYRFHIEGTTTGDILTLYNHDITVVYHNGPISNSVINMDIPVNSRESGGFTLRIGGEDTITTITRMVLEEVPPLPGFYHGHKYLECATAGDILFNSEQAFGIWEMDVYQGSTSNLLTLAPITNDLTDFYATGNISIEINPNEHIALYCNGSIFESADGYVMPETWYRLQLIRFDAQTWMARIKGDVFGTDAWIPISTVGGSGSNPGTKSSQPITSKYTCLRFDAGDRITNIRYSPVIPSSLRTLLD